MDRWIHCSGTGMANEFSLFAYRLLQDAGFLAEFNTYVDAIVIQPSYVSEVCESFHFFSIDIIW